MTVIGVPRMAKATLVARGPEGFYGFELQCDEHRILILQEMLCVNGQRWIPSLEDHPRKKTSPWLTAYTAVSAQHQNLISPSEQL